MNDTIFLVGNAQFVLLMRTHTIYISKVATAGATAWTFQETLVRRTQTNSATPYQQPGSAADEQQQYRMALAASQVRFIFLFFGGFWIKRQHKSVQKDTKSVKRTDLFSKTTRLANNSIVSRSHIIVSTQCHIPNVHIQKLQIWELHHMFSWECTVCFVDAYTHTIYISKVAAAGATTGATVGATAGTFQEAFARRTQPNSATTYQQPESAFDEEQQYIMALAASQVRFFMPFR